MLDPACGSGSFLIGAYQYLLDWHRDWYVADGPAKHRRELYEGAGGEWRLATAEKRRILLNNVYGVDIDTQAVEVTKLSLLLKVLEGESEQTLGNQLRMFHERALPDLGSNIKSGNSLVGSDFYENAQVSLLDDEEQYRVNAFDWEREFPDIMRDGGFDAVIGNPPYRMLQPHNTDQETLAYMREHYLAAEFKIELFHLFMQRGALLLKGGGYLGYIIPTTLLNNVYAATLRKWLLDKTCVESISVARDQIFADADVHTTVAVLRGEADERSRARHEVLTTSAFDSEVALKPIEYSRVRQEWFSKLPGCVWNIMVDDENAPLISRLTQGFTPLGQVAAINRGLITGDKKRYFSESKDSDAHVPILAGGDVTRYYTKPPSQFVLFERPKTSGGCWDRAVHFAPHKLIMRQIGESPTASVVLEPLAVTGNIFTVMSGEAEGDLYLLGLINSKLIAYFWRVMFADFKRSFPQVTIFSLSQIPIRTIDFSDPADKTRHDRVVALVEQMLVLNKQLVAARTPGERARLERLIGAADRQIDRLVYEIYGLTDAEVETVERAAAAS